MATARIPQPITEDPVRVDPKHYKVEFENERVRVLRIKYGSTDRASKLLRDKSRWYEHGDDE